MADYTKTTGDTGKMMIRDTGTSVEFWFKAGYSSDWVNGLKFNWTANGSTTSKSINYPQGADWYHVGSVNVKTNQTVTFRLLSDTSISGIGGPTTFSHSITRVTVPSAPTKPTLTDVSAAGVTVSFKANSNGGSTILGYQIAYSTSSGTPSSSGTDYPVVSSDGSTAITGLSPATTYHFWARAQNKIGWSSWSSSASVKTTAGVHILVGSTWKVAEAYVNVGGVWKTAEPWVRVTGAWKQTD